MKCYANKKGSAVQQRTAKAEPDRTGTSEVDKGRASEHPNDDHNTAFFEPSYHPEAASSDGRERVWQNVGKSAVLIFPEAQKGKDKKATKDTNEL